LNVMPIYVFSLQCCLTLNVMPIYVFSLQFYKTPKKDVGSGPDQNKTSERRWLMLTEV
jgi:hypothetical protein